VTASAGKAVHDVLVTPLPTGGPGALSILSFEDHLLRRFGSAQLVRLEPGETFSGLRASADEVWALIEGGAEFHLEDTRPISPTLGVLQSVVADGPTRLLVPFGVRLRVHPHPRAVLLRIMTHTEREDPPEPEGA
jgi:hypothetical protein